MESPAGAHVPALLLASEAQQMRQRLAAVATSVGFRAALRIFHTQYDSYLASPGHLLLSARPPPADLPPAPADLSTTPPSPEITARAALHHFFFLKNIYSRIE